MPHNTTTDRAPDYTVPREHVPDGWPRCRVCGCWEYDPCVGADELPCHWAEADLCSECAGEADHAA